MSVDGTGAGGLRFARLDEIAARDRAREVVRLPATFLVITGSLGCLVALVVASLVVALSQPEPGAPDRSAGMAIALVMTFGMLVLNAGAIMGGISLLRMSSYRWALVGSLCATINLTCTVLGMAVGVWNLVVLQKSEVRAGFGIEAPEALPPLSPPPDPGAIYGDERIRSDAGQRLVLPAICLAIVGLGGLLVSVFAFIDPKSPDIAESDPVRDSAAMSLAIGTGYSLVSLVVLGGAAAMLRQRWFPLAVAGCVLAIFPCGCVLLAVPIGIWGLVMLHKPEIRASFLRR